MVWNWLYRSPLFASLSTVGMWIGPPKALDWPNPMSSISTISTLGASAGAFTSNRGGAFAFRTSSSVIVGDLGSGIGRTVRSRAPSAASGGADTAAFPAKGPPAAIQPNTMPTPITTSAGSLAASRITASFRQATHEFKEMTQIWDRFSPVR